MSIYFLSFVGIFVLASFYAVFRNREKKHRPNSKNNWVNQDYTRFESKGKPRATGHDFSDGGHG